MKKLLPFLTVFALACQASAQTDPALAAESVRRAATVWGLQQIGQDQTTANIYMNLAVEQRVAQDAARLGLPERMDVQRAMADARRQVMIAAMQDEIARRVAVPTDEEAKKFYNEKPSNFTLTEAFQLSVYEWTEENAAAAADAAVELAKGPVDEAKIAEWKGQVIISKENNTWVTANQVSKELWTGLMTLKDGQAKMFTLPGGRAWVQRKAYRAERLPTFDEAANDVRGALLMQRRQTAWAEYVQRAQSEVLP
jgi:hypothetical protein